MARSLNKVTLIGNLTRDPDLRYTPSGAAVCSFSIATNRVWNTDAGEKKEDVEFHNLVAWNKLAELCGQYLSKGRRVYVEGRLQTRKWTGQDEVERRTTEIVVSEIIFLDAKGDSPADSASSSYDDIPEDLGSVDMDKPEDNSKSKAPAKENVADAKKSTKSAPKESEDEDIPF